MSAVRDILNRKGSTIVAMPITATVVDAARLMSEQGIGGVLVLQEGKLAGIFTERDVLRRVVAERRHPDRTTLGDVMTTAVITCSPDTTLEECRAVMTTRRVRHLPVVGPEGLCGVISSGDVLAYQLDDQQATIQDLNKYVFDVR